MQDSKMIFGIYCEVSIETLREIQLKYCEDYESLVQFLADFHLIKNKPALLVIDGLDFYVEARAVQGPITRQMRLHFLLTLIRDCQRHLDSTSIFTANNLIVSYRSAPRSADPAAELSDNDFSKLYFDFSRYTNQIFYLSRGEVSAETDALLLAAQLNRV